MKRGIKAGRQFHGVATVGEKGQIVIPANARKIMRLKKGDKLLVFGMGNEMLAFSRLAHMERFISKISKQLGKIKKIINKK